MFVVHCSYLPIFFCFPPAPKKMKLFSFMDAHSQHSHLSMRQELMDYFKTASLEYDNDPLAWWKSHASDLPHVARTWKTSVLSIPASPALVERIFCTAGKILRPERTRLQRRSLSSWFLPLHATSNGAVMPSHDVCLSVRLSVCL